MSRVHGCDDISDPVLLKRADPLKEGQDEMKCSWWALLPSAYALFTAAGLWVVYFVAVHNEKVTPLTSQIWGSNGSLFPPYISIAGNFPPASCIFSQVMNMSAFGGCVFAILRHVQLTGRLANIWLNRCSLAAFLLSCSGMTILGNFQLFPQERIHNLGTAMTFSLGALYCWLQAFITLRVNLWGEGPPTAAIRFLLSACITLCMVIYPSLMSWRLHMDAARCQWALVSFFLLFVATFSLEFRHSSFHFLCVDSSSRPIRQFDADDDSAPPMTLSHL